MRMRIALPFAAAVAAAACQPARDVAADHAWVRLAAVAGNPAAAYFTVHGGPKDEVLTAVTAADAQSAEMHESMAAGGTMSMKPLKLVAVRAGGEVAFAPGGKHVMLYNLNPAVLASGVAPLTLTFGSGRTVTVKAKVIGAGDPAPGG